MGYTILQQGAKPPTVEQLKRALGGVPGLLAPDANMHCKETFGIIVRNFSGPQAAALQAGLKTEGIETEIVEDASLPALPVIKVVRRLDCVPEALMIYDPYGRKFPVEWGHVMLIAAGSVRQATFERKRTEVVDTKITFAHGIIPVQERTVKVGYTTQEKAAESLRAEIVLTRGVAQYTIEAAGFNYSGLGERVTQNPTTNFLLVLRELAKYAPQATLNRGAAAMLAEPAATVAYPHKNSLQDEIQWWLWKLNRQQP
jgi:hypothetical protein